MHDEADTAATLQLLENEYQLMAQRQQARPGPQLFGPDGVTVLCWECEQPIPPERLEKHPQSTFCVPCLEIIELRKRRGEW